MKKALITGITGQDGSYLAEFLLEKGYEVHGITRRASLANTARIEHILDKITLHDGDLSDSSSLIRIINIVQPDEIYNLAAQSHVQVSFDVPEYSGDVDALGVLRILEACRILGLTKKTKVYQASTSELYGKVEEVPQRETTPFHPYSPYAVAKQYGFWIVKEYREAYGMFAVNGILFNHESERRGENFVTRKITLAAGRIAEGIQDHLELGNMDSLRDWGYAKDYVECMWMIMQHETPEDFVIATGEQHTVRDFTEKAFAANGITIRWEGTGLEEKGYDPLVYRFFCLQSHYRKALVFTWENLDNAKIAYDKLIARIAALNPENGSVDEASMSVLKEKFQKALDADLNTSLAITTLYDVLKADMNDATKLALLDNFDQVLGLALLSHAEEKRKEAVKTTFASTASGYQITGEGDPEIDALVLKRYEAKKAKNFAEADKIRDDLKAQGIEVTDVRGGAVWKRI